MQTHLALLLLVCTVPVFAAAPADLQPLPEIPPPPVPDNTPPAPTGLIDEDLEPDIKIIKRKDALIHEYRANGRLYMVKVEPTHGYPYYLYDSDGDGSLESRQDRLEPVIPRWVIYSW